jgi:hypothetical protein
VLLGFGTLLFVASMQTRWVRLPGSSSGSSSGSLAWVGPYLVGSIVLAGLAGLAFTATGPGRRLLRIFGTCLAVTLAAFALTVPVGMTPSATGPGVGVGLGVATSTLYLASLWLQPGHRRAADTQLRTSTVVSLLLFTAGLGLMLVSAFLPWWHTTYVDGVQTVGGAVALGRVFPLWLPPVGAAVAAFAMRGPGRHGAGIVGASLGVVVLLGCSGLTGIYWSFAATDALAKEHGMTGTRPDVGLVVALVSLVLLTLCGAVQFIVRSR